MAHEATVEHCPPAARFVETFHVGPARRVDAAEGIVKRLAWGAVGSGVADFLTRRHGRSSIRKYFAVSADQSLYNPQRLRLNDLNKTMGDHMDHKTEAAKFVAAVEAMGLIAHVTEAMGGSVYVNVLQPVLTKSGAVAKNRQPKHTRFKARFATHGQVYFACVSVDPTSGATVEDALSCLRYHLTGEGEAPVVPVAMLFPQDGTVETKTATYNRRAAMNGMAPLF